VGSSPSKERSAGGCPLGDEAGDAAADAGVAAVLFDLDGTLADTAPDLAYALNVVRTEQGLPPLPFEHIRPVVSHGAMALVRLGFGFGPENPAFGGLRTRLLEVYRANLARETRLFPGIAELLERLEQSSVRWGVVTNKPTWLTDPLMEALGVAHRAACIVSGDTTAQRKPHPEPMLHACALAACHPGACLYVGDAERDVQAGRAAGMRTLVALFGYIDPAERPQEWGADGAVAQPLDILDWLDGRSARPATPRLRGLGAG
jgi:N-acetyl-D-muramate 6-phosphate phosphatase